MMVAMMLPSAAPMVLLFAAVNRKTRQQGRPYARTFFFTAGYLVAWGGFSLVAVFLQWGLERLLLLWPTLHVSSLYLGAALLIGAGVYQLTPLKHACLRHCRSPIEFIARYWRQGAGGAFEHYCGGRGGSSDGGDAGEGGSGGGGEGDAGEGGGDGGGAI